MKGRGVTAQINMEYYSHPNMQSWAVTSRLNWPITVNNQSLIPSNDVLQITLTLKLSSAHGLSKRQALSRTTVLLMTTFTRTIIINLLLKKERVTQNLRNFSDIARHYEYVVKASSLLASLAIISIKVDSKNFCQKYQQGSYWRRFSLNSGVQ